MAFSIYLLAAIHLCSCHKNIKFQLWAENIISVSDFKVLSPYLDSSKLFEDREYCVSFWIPQILLEPSTLHYHDIGSILPLKKRESVCVCSSQYHSPQPLPCPWLVGSQYMSVDLNTWKNSANSGTCSIFEDISDEDRNVQWHINHWLVENEKGVVSSGWRMHWLSLVREENKRRVWVIYCHVTNNSQAVAALNNTHLLCGDQETDRNLAGCFWLAVCHEIAIKWLLARTAVIRRFEWGWGRKSPSLSSGLHRSAHDLAGGFPGERHLREKEREHLRQKLTCVWERTVQGREQQEAATIGGCICSMRIVNIQCCFQRGLGTPLGKLKILFSTPPLSVALPFLLALAGKIDFSTKGLGLLAYFSECEHRAKREKNSQFYKLTWHGLFQKKHCGMLVLWGSHFFFF